MALESVGHRVPPDAYLGEQLLNPSNPLAAGSIHNAAVIAAAPIAAQPPKLLELVATEGPAVGAHLRLTETARRIGRDPAMDLCLPDPDLSRDHVMIALDQGRAVLVDAGSTNGTFVDDTKIGPTRPVELRAGMRLRIGNSTLVLARTATSAGRSDVDETGRARIQRPPRLPPIVHEVALRRPTAPAPRERRSLPWLMLLLPVIAACAMVLLLHNTTFLLFALLSPAMMLGQYLTDRRGSGAQHRRQQAEHEAACRKLAADQTSALDDEVRIRRVITPPISDCRRSATMRDERLWSRSPDHPDFLHVRIGVGTVTSRVRIREDGLDSAPTQLPLPDAPITLDLTSSRIVGIAGADDTVHRLADGIAVQVATWQSPVHVRIAVICSTAARRRRWTWLRNLPHVTPAPSDFSALVDLESSADLVLQLLEGLRPSDPDKSAAAREEPAVSTLVILDGADALLDVSAVTSLLERVRSVGVSVLALGETGSDLPTASSQLVTVDATHVRARGEVDADGRLDLPVPDLCRATAMELAGLVDATPDASGGAIPAQAALVAQWRDVRGADPLTAEAVAQQWRSHPRTTRAPLGVTGSGPLEIDLATDGPHILLAGTTGAGKSELLQTLVASLALGNRPDELVFVLVDYKGGAAFKDCARLPHTVGLVTDLDAHLTARALTSLDAEVRRRERVLAAAGAKDLEDYQRLPGRSPLPRLALVIDEFRVLAQEMPDFIAGLVRIAAVGRSLGIHLVLATQRPGGVVSPDIRANVNLRISLRVRDESDSQDVIGSREAARIGADRPGRGLLRVGGGAPVEFQTARVGGCSTAEDRSVRIVPIDDATGQPASRAPVATDDPDTTDLAAIVQAVQVATAGVGAQVPPSPWLPPLATRLDCAALEAAERSVLGRAATDAIAFARADLPGEQRAATLGWQPLEDGQLSIVGGPRSGRTTCVATIAVQAARLHPRSGLTFYVVDGSSALGGLAGLPQCGAVINPEDTGRLTRLVAWLSEEIRRRQQHAGATHRILLLIDGWESVHEVSEDSTMGRLTEEVLQILRDGVSVGVHAVVTGGRALYSGRVSAAFSSRVVLRLADPSEAALIGLRANQFPTAMSAGRGLTAPDGIEIQIAMPQPDDDMSLTELVASLARHMSAPDVVRFDSIPQHCAEADLPTDPHRVLVGIGGPDPQPIGLPLGPNGDLSALIAGPSGSGRTRALRTIATRLAASRDLCWISGRDTAPGDLPTSCALLSPDDPQQLATWLRGHADGAVLVDDVEELGSGPAEDLLVEHLARSRQFGGIVCATGQSSTLANSFRGVVAELRRRQTGIILQPGRRDGDLLSARLDPGGRPRPGYGALVIRGRACAIQIAC